MQPQQARPLPAAERILLPIVDVLRSVPILSFLPVVVLAFLALLPERAALELGAIVLIFTSQVWNLTFSFYRRSRPCPGSCARPPAPSASGARCTSPPGGAL